MPGAFERLQLRISRRDAWVVVIGLGYVGLPMAVALAESRFHVVGLDQNLQRLKTLRTGKTYVPDVPAVRIRKLMAAKRFRVTSHPACIQQADVVVICVPTPMLKTREPDLSYVLSAVRTVAKHLRQATLVILESTTYPGTTDGVVRQELEAAGHRLDQDVFLAFSPERIDPGNRQFAMTDIPKLVGGVTPKATQLADSFYSQRLTRVIPVASSRVAETAKLLENTFRIINIGLANEFALLCHAIDVDVWEVIKAASTKPFGFMPFYPGPGIGGHCIPSDPIYLSWRARAAGFEARMIDLAAHINTRMPAYVIERVADVLNDRKRSLKGSRILVLGVAYKRDINDTRDSPALEIVEGLHRKGARVSYHDPYVPSIRTDSRRWTSQGLREPFLKTVDCAVITTDHTTVNYPLIAKHVPVIFDTRNVMQAVPSSFAKVVRL